MFHSWCTAEFHKDREPTESSKDSGNRESGAIGNHSSHSNSAGERQSKRARRSRPDNVRIKTIAQEHLLQLNLFFSFRIGKHQCLQLLSILVLHREKVLMSAIQQHLQVVLVF